MHFALLPVVFEGLYMFVLFPEPATVLYSIAVPSQHT